MRSTIRLTPYARQAGSLTPLREVSIREVKEPGPVHLAQFVLRVAAVLHEVADAGARERLFISDNARADQTIAVIKGRDRVSAVDGVFDRPGAGLCSAARVGRPMPGAAFATVRHPRLRQRDRRIIQHRVVAAEVECDKYRGGRSPLIRD